MSNMSIKDMEMIADTIERWGGDDFMDINGVTDRASQFAMIALRQLMNEQKWKPIDDEAKQGVVLISDNDKFSKAAIWDEAGDAAYPWKFFDSDGTINRVMAEYVTGWLPLPSPPETSDV